jgi:hypothetical protein
MHEFSVTGRFRPAPFFAGETRFAARVNQVARICSDRLAIMAAGNVQTGAPPAVTEMATVTTPMAMPLRY